MGRSGTKWEGQQRRGLCYDRRRQLMSSDTLTDNLLPEGLVKELASGTLAQFQEVNGETDLLLVHLPKESGELNSGLQSTAAGTGTTLRPSLSVLGYETVSQPLDDALESAARRRTLLSRAELTRRAANERLFAVTLRKRSSETYADRISVGRARNKDIVLRDASVSKFHAWFEVDENNRLFVVDAGSRNGTKLNDTRLTPRTPLLAQSGDEILFGAVRALVCDPGLLWKALRC